MISGEYAQRNEAGIHKSRFRGRGTDLADIREYAFGDDIRSMDWNVTARYHKPHIRIHNTDRERTLYLVIDRSASSTFGTDVSKELKALEISATILYSVLKEGDAAGVLLFTDRVEKYIPARKGMKHAAAAINTIISHAPVSNQTDLGHAAEYLLGRLKRKSQIVIISDFDSANFEDAIALLSRTHDVQAIRLQDNRESEIPDVGLIEIVDPETGEHMLIDTSDTEFRKQYQLIAEAHERKLTNYFRKNRIPALDVPTSDAYRDVFVKLNTFYRGPA